MKKVLSLFALCAMFAFAGCNKDKSTEKSKYPKKDHMKKDRMKKDHMKKEKCKTKACKSKKDMMK